MTVASSNWMVAVLGGALVVACGDDASSPGGDTDPAAGSTSTGLSAGSGTTEAETPIGTTEDGTSTGGPDGTSSGSADSSTSGEESSSSSGGPPLDVQCPTDAPGPAMLELSAGYCIDATEVTREQYAAWLDTAPAVDGQPEVCAWNDDFTPPCAWPPGSTPNRPVACVDWCDARAYCESAGKRLCGRIGGGANAFEDYASAARSEWFDACTSHGQHDYTYGSEHDPAACRGADEDMWAWIDVGSLSTCQSPESEYAGIYDLSGNVMEWEDSCDADAGPDDHCRVRGGSFNYSADGLRCDMGENLLFARSAYYVGVGFRCCAS